MLCCVVVVDRGQSMSTCSGHFVEDAPFIMLLMIVLLMLVMIPSVVFIVTVLLVALVRLNG